MRASVRERGNGRNVTMSAQILQLTLLPGIDTVEFERTLKDSILPKVQIEHRTVVATYHRVFRADVCAPHSSTYVWLVFTKLVGPTPDTAGEGPVILCELPLPVEKIASYIASLATMTTLSKI
jgi:hypothetical protein